MYDLFGDKFDLNHDGKLSAAEHMMDFSVFNYWATDDDDDGASRKRSSESYFDDDDRLDDFDASDDDDIDDYEDFEDSNEVAEALEDAGIDFDEFESMTFREQCEALEDAGLDPDEHRFNYEGQPNRGCPCSLGRFPRTLKPLPLHTAGHDVIAATSLLGYC